MPSSTAAVPRETAARLSDADEPWPTTPCQSSLPQHTHHRELQRDAFQGVERHWQQRVQLLVCSCSLTSHVCSSSKFDQSRTCAAPRVPGPRSTKTCLQPAPSFFLEPLPATALDGFEPAASRAPRQPLHFRWENTFHCPWHLASGSFFPAFFLSFFPPFLLLFQPFTISPPFFLCPAFSIFLPFSLFQGPPFTL